MRINNQWLMEASLFKSVRLAEQAVIAAAELAGDALIFFAALGLLLGSQVLEKEVREPSSAVEWKQLGLDLASRQKLDAASSAFEKACALDTREEDACYYYARTLHALGRWEEARDPFEKALRTAPKSKLARTHRAVALNFVALSRAAEAE